MLLIPEYMTAKEASSKWGVTTRYVNFLCHNGKIPGAQMFGKSWAIPTGTAKPSQDRRVKSGEYKDWRKKYGKEKIHGFSSMSVNKN